MLGVPHKEGGHNSVLVRPLGHSEPTMNRIWSDMVFIAPLSQGLRNPVDGEHRRLARVSSLFGSRGPATVLREVALAVVDAIYAVLRAWPWSHVREEVFKVVPPLAYRDAPVLVQSNVFWPGSEATVSHLAPDLVFGSGIEPMSDVCLDGAFPLEASTTQGVSASKVHQGDRGFRSTIAHYKSLVVDVLPRELFYDKPPVAFSYLKGFLIHNSILTPKSTFVKESEV